MKTVNVEDVKPGHVLAEAVTNANGGVLCPRGLELTEATIQRLKSAGVEMVALQSDAAGRPQLETRIAKLNDRFDGIDDPIMLQLKATIENRLRAMQTDEDAAP